MKKFNNLKVVHQLNRNKDNSQTLRFFAVSKNGKKRRIGSIHLYKVRNRWETHSNLYRKYRNRGIGQWMYQRAIDIVTQRGDSIGSTHYPSNMAMRAWKGRALNKKYKIIKRSNGPYLVRERKKSFSNK